MGLKRDLTGFDLTNIIVGSIVGADIYIASALTAGLVGPFAIVIWVLAGLFAAVIALVFAYCSFYVPRAGGPFAYVSEAFDDFYGFMTGWSLWIAELVALPVFAIAFSNYLQALLPLDPVMEVATRALFIGSIVLINIIGVKAAGRLNDVLTIIKLLPLILLIFAGLFMLFTRPEPFLGNYIPFLPLGVGAAPHALVLVFWAYVGFEMGTFPASEVVDPKRTIPRAIAGGMAIVGTFYILTNLVLYGVVNWTDLAQTTTPLVTAGAVLFGAAGVVLMTVGALFSVSGSDASGVLGSSRLAYAMAIDGLFPAFFARLHPRFGTPYIILIVEGALAFVLSLYTDFARLISFSVLNMAFSFLLTCFALIVLKKNEETSLHGQTILPLSGIGICLFLIASTGFIDKIAGVLVILAGVPIYVYFSPKQDILHLKRLFLSEEAVFFRALETHEQLLANAVGLVREIAKKVKGER